MNPRLALSAATVLAAMVAGSACATRSSTPESSMTANVLTERETRDGWRLLFDGRSTAGWRGYRKQAVSSGWQVIDGSLVRTGADAGDIVTDSKYRNFELALDWKVSEGGNSGVFYRATEDADNIWQSAPEMQILDDARHVDGKSPLTSAGANYAIHPAPRGVVRPAGEWNAARLLVNGAHVEHWLNGVKLLEYELGSTEWANLVAKSKFATLPHYGKSGEGYIGLQDHGDRVEFRNIRVRVLP